MENFTRIRPLPWAAGMLLALVLCASGCAISDKPKTVDYGYGMDFQENPVP